MGDWIQHDGRGAPPEPHKVKMDLKFERAGIAPENPLGPDWPGWTWRWRRKYVLFGPWVRRCNNPTIAPIVAYRIRDHRKGDAKVIELLRAVARGAHPPNGQEGPVRAPQRVEQ